MVRVVNQELAQALISKRFVALDEFTAPILTPATPVEESAGKPFGKYLLLRQIGEGGFSRVFLGLDPLLQRQVAIKIMKRGTAEDVARFGREARLAAELRHPNLVPVHEVGQVGKDCFIAMEYIEGSPPAPSEVETSLRILLKTARAVDVAHARGMIHRDIKPQNILVNAAGEPFLTDFGMAKHFDRGDTGPQTQSGSLVGTPMFMSPEQARGEIRTLGPAVDVFALGATLYYLLTGRAPFEGETSLGIIRRVVENKPVPPRAIDPRIPASVEAIVRKAMALDPRDRYATAGELADDLERFLGRHPVRAARRRMGRAIAASLSALLLIGMVLLIFRKGPEPAPPPPPPVAKKPAPPVPPPGPLLITHPVALKETPPAVAPPVAEPPKLLEPFDSAGSTLLTTSQGKPLLPAIDPTLKARVRARVLDQPAYFLRTFLAETELRRARELVEKERAAEADIVFLSGRVLEAGDQIDREKDHLASAVASREPALRRVEAPDVIRFRDGRRHEGKVVEETDVLVRYLYRGQTVAQPRSEVEAIVKGGAPAMEFLKKLESAAGPALVELAGWCREKGLAKQREYVFYRMLSVDPGSAIARRELNLPLSGALKDAAAPERMYSYDGKTWTAEDLRRTLLDRGFVIVGDQWCATREWKWSPREYWKMKSFGGAGAAIQVWEETRVETAYNVELLKLVETRRSVPLYHFIGPVMGREGRAKGSAVIDVEAPCLIVECRILAAAAVIQGRGSIQVSVTSEGRPPAPLYSITSGTHRKGVEVGAALRGARKFSIVAEMESDATPDPDRRVQSCVHFLPGDAKDPEPLVIEGKVAEPVPALNQLLPLK